MKKIKFYLKLLCKKIKIWYWFLRRRNKFKMTGRGLYLFNYLVKKYLEEDATVEPMEDYETVINHLEKEFADKPLPPELTLHDFSAITVSLIIFNSISEEDKKKCLSFFTNDEARESFISFYRRFAYFR